LDAEKLKETLAPLKNETVVIGPTNECTSKKSKKKNKQARFTYPSIPSYHQPMQVPHWYPYYY
jgi:hypothetical protein